MAQLALKLSPHAQAIYDRYRSALAEAGFRDDPLTAPVRVESTTRFNVDA